MQRTCWPPVIGLLLGWTAIAATNESPPETATAPGFAFTALRAECNRLHAKGPHCLGGYEYLNAFIDQLARSRDTDALRLVIAHELPGHSHAAVRYNECLGPSESLRFIRTMKPGGRGWHALLWTLSFSHSSEVRDYNRAVFHAHPAARSMCYEIDFCRHWGDLVDAARKDVDSTEPIYEGIWADSIVDDRAREYLGRFDKNRPLPPRKPRPIPDQ